MAEEPVAGPVDWEPYLKRKSSVGIKVEGAEVRIENADNAWASQTAVTVQNDSKDLTFAYTRVEDQPLGASTEVRLAPGTKLREKGNVGLGTPDVLLKDPRTEAWGGGAGDGEKVTGLEDAQFWLRENWMYLAAAIALLIVTLIVLWKAGLITREDVHRTRAKVEGYIR